MNRGKFIVLDGGEGSGKSTQIKHLKEIYSDGSIIFSREPGGSPFAEKIRSVILSDDAKDADANTQFGLFWAARADHMKNTIIPALEKGVHVVCDRFDSSSYAYQIHGQENSHLKELFFEMRKVYLGKYVPDLYVFLDVDPKVGCERRHNQKGSVNHFDDRNMAFHERIREGFKEFFAKVNHKTIDSNCKLEDMTKEVENTIKQAIK